MAVSSERRDIQGIHKTVRRQRSRSNRRAGSRTANSSLMSVTPDVQDVTSSGSLRVAFERKQTSPVALGVSDAVDSASIAPTAAQWATDGDAVVRP